MPLVRRSQRLALQLGGLVLVAALIEDDREACGASQGHRSEGNEGNGEVEIKCKSSGRLGGERTVERDEQVRVAGEVDDAPTRERLAEVLLGLE